MDKSIPSNLNLTAEEYQAIMALPTKTIRVAGDICQAKVNPEDDYVYFLDSTGELTGKRARATRPASIQPDQPIPTAEQQSEPEQIDPPVESESESTGDAVQDNTQEHRKHPIKEKRIKREKKPSRTKGNDKEKRAGITPSKQNIILLLCAGVLLILVFAMDRTPKENPSLQNDPQRPAVTSDVTDLSQIEVVQVVGDLIPGDIISEDLVQQATISAETYNQIVLGGSNIYQWSRLDSILGKYVVDYIPQGQYLTYTNVDSVFTVPNNPWKSSNPGVSYVTIPLSNAEDISYGSIISLNIRKETVHQTQVDDTTAEPKDEVDGLQHTSTLQQSVLVDEYALSNIVICDLLNQQKDSIYEKYAALSEIPAGEQETYLENAFLKDQQLEKELKPAYAVIQVTPDQASALGDLTAKGVTVTMSAAGTKDVSTTEKTAFAAKAQSLDRVITTAAANAVKIQEEQDEQQQQ